MVPLRTLVGKMINKAHADLMTLTDTLPSMSDVERKRQILNYTTFTRTQFLKLMNIMAFLANQNKTFQDTVDYLHKIHIELPAARVRNFDILTAVDVLTTGTYQRMPTKIEDMLPPAPLTDQQVLETFTKMNDEIRVRMLTKEILPSTMQKYRIANGRVYFCVNNEFDVSLTLMGNSDDRKWWIVSLDILVQPSPGGSASDVDISLNDVQRQRLRASAQRQLAPPEPQNIDNTTNKELPATDTNTSSNTISRDTISRDTKTADEQQPSDRELFFPLVNLYDYLHLFCLNMQLEIVYMQATMMAKTQWLDQLKVHMNPARTSLTLLYWGGGSPTAHWGTPQALSIAIRDEYKGLIQKSGIGASVSLANLDEVSKSKVYNSLKYPKTCLEILWSGSSDLHTNENLLNSTDMNIEMLLLHITTYHKQSILCKFRQLLNSESAFLEANGLQLVDSLAEDNSTDISSGGQPLVVRYRHDRYIYIDFDSRVGRVKVRETGKHGGDGNAKLGGLEDRLNSDPTNIGRHLLWLRSEVVVHEIVSLAKQLNLQPFHPSQMLLRPDDMLKLFGDLPTTTPDPVELPPSRNRSPNFPQHFVFLQFSQFEDWYLVIAVIKNEFQPSLCCLR
ncbi:mediator complex subunit MED14-domain-containing protein [Absidia repens]|uniref:Mediator of RNA polymerase II transcription subunit 14 n=1 Tax=Absidia repens TaxID=90262 RepID=A0A1X2IKS5_9FUNG|nr:mediator complex subunit MED14-domain-containing protein [Absidia repens]